MNTTNNTPRTSNAATTSSGPATTAANVLATRHAGAEAGRGAVHRWTTTGPYLSVVVPVWNGAATLATTLRSLDAFLRHQSYRAEIVVVDDHSDDATVRVLRHWARRRADVTVLRNDRNRGKGHAVARGMRVARGRYRVFTDADLAYPADSIATILEALEDGNDVAIATRRSTSVTSPSRRPGAAGRGRRVMSRAFNLLVQGLLLPGVADTQAGLKGFTTEAAELIFARLTVDRFAFDVEALYIAYRHGLRVLQAPVHVRAEEGGATSTVRPVRDATHMAADVLRVRWSAWRGRYR